jgi:hypothetical protein
MEKLSGVNISTCFGATRTLTDRNFLSGDIMNRDTRLHSKARWMLFCFALFVTAHSSHLLASDNNSSIDCNIDLPLYEQEWAYERLLDEETEFLKQV